MTRPWPITAILGIQGDRARFAHVAKHLYNPREQWQQVISGLGDARQRAWDNGCAKALLDATPADCCRVAPSCRAHVLRDHDHLYAPAYESELAVADAAGRFGKLPTGPRGWAFVGGQGLYVVVREVGYTRSPEVKTAYRVEPLRGRRAPDDFQREAVRKLRDKTSWTGGGT